MSFANEYRRAVKEIGEEIAYYRGFARLAGTEEPLAALVEMRDDWEERRLRFEGRGRPPSEPADWDDNKTDRVAAKDCLDKIIKAAAAAEEAEREQAKRAEAMREQAKSAESPPDETPPAAAQSQVPSSSQ